MVATRQALGALEERVEIIDVSIDDAYSGITNSVRLAGKLLCASNIEELGSSHPDYGYEKAKLATLDRICAEHRMEPVIFNLSELQKSGAMLSCLLMHLDRASYEHLEGAAEKVAGGGAEIDPQALPPAGENAASRPPG